MLDNNTLVAKNAILLATVYEITKKVISELDGSALSVTADNEKLDDDILNRLITSRIRLEASKLKQGSRYVKQ